MSKSPRPADPSPAGELTEQLLCHQEWVRRLAVRLVGEGGEDVAQEVAAISLQRAGSARSLASPRAWLGAVTRKRAARWIRDRRQERALCAPTGGPESLDAVARSHDPAATAARLELEQKLVQAVTDLPEPYRSAVVARYFDDLSAPEIAAQRGIRPAAARLHVHRGLEMLRASLQQRIGGDWRLALGLLAWPSRATVARPTTGGALGATAGIAGALVMKKWVLAGVCVLVGLLVWTNLESGPETSPVPEVPRDSLGSMAAATTPGEATAPNTPELWSSNRVAIGSARCRVRVLDGGGQPVGNARVLACVESRVYEGRTDASGEVAWDREWLRPEASVTADLLVGARGHAPSFRPQVTLRGEVTMRLPAGVVVAGRVRVVKARFAPSIPLILRSDRAWDELRDLPRPLQQAVDAASLSLLPLSSASTWTDRNGFFSFTVPSGWSGTLGVHLNAPYWFHPNHRMPVEGPRAVRLTEPRQNLDLLVTRIPSIVGRVRLANGKPALGATVATTGFIEADEVGDRLRRHAAAATIWREDGSFEIAAAGDAADHLRMLDPDRQPPVVRSMLTVRHPSAPAWSRGMPASSPAAQLDVGVIVLDSQPEYQVLVMDPSGEPLMDAVVEDASNRGRGANPRTDLRGRTSVFAQAGQREFRIGAPGGIVSTYRARAGHGTTDEPYELVVPQANRLTVRVRLQSPCAALRAGELWLRVESDGPIFTPGRSHGSGGALHEAAGTDRILETAVGPSETYVLLPVSATGTVTMASLRPGMTVSLKLIDRLGEVLGEQSATLPGPGERAEVEVSAKRPLTVVRLQVQSRGERARQIGVTFRRGDRFVQVSADSSEELVWHFATEGSQPTAPILALVDAADHAMVTLTLRARRPTVTKRVVLESAHVLVVETRDRAGALVDAKLEVEGRAQALRRSKLGPGRWRIERLPPRPLRISARIGSRRAEQVVNPKLVPMLSLTLPD